MSSMFTNVKTRVPPYNSQD